MTPRGLFIFLFKGQNHNKSALSQFGLRLHTLSNEFIDIHCHILPGLDEGSSGIEETEKMLRIAGNDGICGIVATPHIIDGLYDNTRKTIQEAIAGLKKTNDTCQIYTGAEVRIGRNMLSRIIEQELPLLNDKRYFLLELPASGSLPVEGVENIVRSLTSNGITPIIAHPERNMVIVKDLSWRLIARRPFPGDCNEHYRAVRQRHKETFLYDDKKRIHP